MANRTMDLPSDPADAAARLRHASRTATVVVFKKSPVCPISFHAEDQYRTWLQGRSGGSDLLVAEIDVIAEKPLARGLVRELGIPHQSPQALVFRGGEVVWHDSHEGLTVESFREHVDGR